MPNPVTPFSEYASNPLFSVMLHEFAKILLMKLCSRIERIQKHNLDAAKSLQASVSLFDS